jgi:hypothetical protein
MKRQHIISLLLTTFLIIFMTGNGLAQDPLPSWNDGAAKKALLEFVAEVTNEKGGQYVEPIEQKWFRKIKQAVGEESVTRRDKERSQKGAENGKLSS